MALLIQGDARRIPLADKSVHCVLTSPPYFNLRDYGVPGQIGLEPTPDDFVAAMVAVGREVRRVLRDDGTYWLNLGDSYNSSPSNQQDGAGFDCPQREGAFRSQGRRKREIPGLKPKDLIGIPWRVALALQADGWWLRSDIIWAKPSPMPESVRDRLTRSHEYVFLLTKRERYFYDAEAVKEAHSPKTVFRYPQPDKASRAGMTRNGKNHSSLRLENPSGRNARTVWSIATRPYKGAHFATFPPALPERCIKAGTSERGCCPSCGAPWRRVVERERRATRPGTDSKLNDLNISAMVGRGPASNVTGYRNPLRRATTTATLGWQPGCACYDDRYRALPRARSCRKRRQQDAARRWWQRARRRPGGADWPTVPCRVYDPFGGSGTAAKVAEELGRIGIVTDLSAEYMALARERLAGPPCLTKAKARRPREDRGPQLALFDMA